MESGFRDMVTEVKEKSRALPRLFGRMLFPHFCVSCGDEGAVLCDPCRSARTPLAGVFACPGCRVATPFGVHCGSRRCLRLPLDGLVAAAPYADRVASALLRLYKYEGVDEARRELVTVFDGFLSRTGPTLGTLFAGANVVAVPLHFFRRATRGFNQADLFAERLAAAVGATCPAVGVLRRDGLPSAAQATITDADVRRENVSGRFAARVPCRGDWIVVDDVSTTGATLQDCARALKAAGAGRVWGLTLLRG